MIIPNEILIIFAIIGLLTTCFICYEIISQSSYWLKNKEFKLTPAEIKLNYLTQINKLETERLKEDLHIARARADKFEKELETVLSKMIGRIGE